MLHRKTYGGSPVYYRSHPKMFRESPGRLLFYILLIPVGYGLYKLARWWIDNLRYRLTITDRLVISEVGIFNKTYTEIHMNDIRSVEIDRTFIERLVGGGSIKIATAGSDGYEIEVRGLPHPMKIRDLIDQFRKHDNAD